MTKTASPVRRARRELNRPALPPKSTIDPSPVPRLHCMACGWRKHSNETLKALIADGRAPAGYSGFLAGAANGGIIVAEYQQGRQVAFLAIPLLMLGETLNLIANTADEYIASMQAQVEPEPGDNDDFGADEAGFTDDDEYEDGPEADEDDEDELTAEEVQAMITAALRAQRAEPAADDEDEEDE